MTSLSQQDEVIKKEWMLSRLVIFIFLDLRLALCFCNFCLKMLFIPKDDQNFWLQFCLDIDLWAGIANLEKEHF